ncbi:MAG: hypothetical protein JXD22_10380 [Sedimentisphaerales bacterium]|nr:hypothetical protein [Sedimentisphaerales bacterium]
MSEIKSSVNNFKRFQSGIRIWLILLPALFLLGVSAGSVYGGPEFNRDGFLMVEGAPRLIIGLYELPGDDKILKQLSESGFNLVRASNRESLERLHQNNIYGWICVSNNTGQKDDDVYKGFVRTITDLKDHPALLAWELPDEALWNVWWSRMGWAMSEQSGALRSHIEKNRSKSSNEETNRRLALLEKANDFTRRGLWKSSEEIFDRLWGELGEENPHPDWKFSLCEKYVLELAQDTAQTCKLIHGIDSKHPVWQNHAPRNSVKHLQLFNQQIDVVGCDIYPAPFAAVGHSDLKDVSLSAVGAYTDRMRAGAPGKGIWMVLQGFGWADIDEGVRNAPDPQKGRQPNYLESRFMAYDAIVHGASAILYWGTSYIPKEGVLWNDLMKITRQIRALEPAIVGDHPEIAPVAIADETYGSIDGQGPLLMLRQSGADWVLIAVNEQIHGVSFVVSSLPKSLEEKTLYRLYSEESHQVKNSGFRDGIRSFGVHIYSTSRRFEVR